MALPAAFDPITEPPGRANAGDGGDPTPRKRRKPLDNLDAVRREMTATYWQIKHGEVDLDKGKGQIYALGKISEVIKVGLAVDDELRELRRLVKAYERNPT
ncbi:MAG: hypothetical protein KIT63_13390 [Rhodoferax sp.]|nr:hypothetical protein [Rhodoferax sp.]